MKFNPMKVFSGFFLLNFYIKGFHFTPIFVIIFMIHYQIKYLMDQMIIGGNNTFMESIVIGVIGADVHAVGNRIIDYVLTNAGYNVINIGVLSSQEDFINAAIEFCAEPLVFQ